MKKSILILILFLAGINLAWSQCTGGPLPAGQTLCPGTNTTPSQPTPYTVVSTCSSPPGTCEVLCNYYGGSCQNRPLNTSLCPGNIEASANFTVVGNSSSDCSDQAVCQVYCTSPYTYNSQNGECVAPGPCDYNNCFYGNPNNCVNYCDPNNTGCTVCDGNGGCVPLCPFPQTCSNGTCSLTCPMNTSFGLPGIQEQACGDECCLGSCNPDNPASCAYDSTNCLNGGAPSCQGSVCGLDPVCGVLDCGTCPSNSTCNVSGQCVCTSICFSGSKCGDPDGCGGTCGPVNCGTSSNCATCATGSCTCLGGQCSLSSGTYICTGCNYQGQIGTGCQGTDTCVNGNLGATCTCSASSGCQGTDTCANGNPGGTCTCPTCPQGQFCSTSGTCTSCPLNNSASCIGTNDGCLNGQVINPTTNTCCTPTVDCNTDPCGYVTDDGCGIACPNICGNNYSCNIYTSDPLNCGGPGVQCPSGTTCTCGNCSACQGAGAVCPTVSGCCLIPASCDESGGCAETCAPYTISGSAGASSGFPTVPSDGTTGTCVCNPSTGQSNWQFDGPICPT